MRDIITVSKFTMKEMLRRKSFIVTTIIIMIVIVIGFNAPNIAKFFANDNGEMLQGEKLIISDSENIYDGKLDELKNDELLEYKIEVVPSTFDEIKTKIQNNEVKAGIIIEKQEDNILFRYIVNDTMATIPENLNKALQKLYTNNQIEKLGLTEQKAKEIMPEFEINTEQTEEVKGNAMVIMAISILLFYAIYFCAYQVSSSITTEKTSKIMETLVTSTSPRTIVVGKTLGIGLGGLLQLLILVLTAVVSAKLFLAPELFSIAVIAHIAIKIYSNAILNYGTKLSINNLVKMYKTK